MNLYIMKDIKFRNADEKDWMKGLDEERAAEKNPFFKAFDNFADDYYKDVYRNRPNSAFGKVFEHDNWCRLMTVEGIPGSGSAELAKKIADHKNMAFSDRPDLYYPYKRFGLQCPMEEKLSDLYKNGQKADKDGHFEGTVALEPGKLGNWYEEQLGMCWNKVYDDPQDEIMACRVTSNQMQAFRVQEMDRIVTYLLGMRGLMCDQTYFSYRAELHAMGETGRIPKDMYQSMIDHYQKMEGQVEPYHFTLYVDCDPVEAYENIQKSDKYTPQQKAFYSLDYLRAYKEGYEEFTLPRIQEDMLDTIVERISHEEARDWDIEYLCDFLECPERYYESKYHFVKVGSWWHPHLFNKGTTTFSNKYYSLLSKNLDLGGWGPHVLTEFDKDASSYCTADMSHGPSSKASNITQWTYPRPWVDPGANWHSTGMGGAAEGNLGNNAVGKQIYWMKDTAKHGVGYGFQKGWNEGEFSYSNPKDIYRMLFDDEAPRIGHTFSGPNTVYRHIPIPAIAILCKQMGLLPVNNHWETFPQQY